MAEVPDLDTLVEEALQGVSRLRTILSRHRGRQISSRDHKALITATTVSWFKRVRPAALHLHDSPWVKELDAAYREMLQATDRDTTKVRYLALISEIRRALVELKAVVVSLPPAPSQEGDLLQSPAFGVLVKDTAMQAVLQRRWREAQLCRNAGAHLAATVMMGSMLEALLLARVNSMADKGPAFRASAAPKDKAGKTYPLREWTLKDYIDVAHELGWIRQSGRDVGSVLRDYRNYVHPAKEYAHGMVLEAGDTEMFWVICRTLTNQVLAS